MAVRKAHPEEADVLATTAGESLPDTRQATPVFRFDLPQIKARAFMARDIHAGYVIMAVWTQADLGEKPKRL